MVERSLEIDMGKVRDQFLRDFRRLCFRSRVTSLPCKSTDALDCSRPLRSKISYLAFQPMQVAINWSRQLTLNGLLMSSQAGDSQSSAKALFRKIRG
jgi:hypothetical protein